MIRPCRSLALLGGLLISSAGCHIAEKAPSPAIDAPPRQTSASDFPPIPVAEDPAALITACMADGWRSAPRRWWRVECRSTDPSKGVTEPVDRAAFRGDRRTLWHIAGTDWWARFHPGNWEFDPRETYEIDAVAVAQNYGVIDFYVYGMRYPQDWIDARSE